MRLELESILPPREEIKRQPPAVDNSKAEAKELLAEGIKAAQSGDRQSARVSLLRSSELDSANESTWLWLASISEYPEELLVFLTNVLELNPENRRALEWTAATKALLSKTFVQRGIDAVDESKADYALQCFNQALEYDQSNTTAWLWLASLCDSYEGKTNYFERVLSIDPSNAAAQSGLRAARHEISQRQLAEARAAAVAGRSAEANEFLDAIIAENPKSEDAWILRAHLAEGFDRKILAFEKVLQLNPENATARSGLDSLLSIIETVSPKPEPMKPQEAEEAAEEPFEESHHVAVTEVAEEKATENESVAADDSESGFNEFVDQLADTPVESAESYDYVSTDEYVESTDLTPPNQSAENESRFEEERSSHSSAFFETADQWTPQPDEPLTGFEMRLEFPATAGEFAEQPENEVREIRAQVIVVDEQSDVNAADFPQDHSNLFSEPIITTEEYQASEVVEPAVETHDHSPEAEVAEGFETENGPFDYDVFDSVRELPEVQVQEPFVDHVEIMPLGNSVVSVADRGNTFSHVSFCPYCHDENDVQAIVCQTCSAVLTLSDLEMLIANTGADKLMLRDSVERMEAEKHKRELSESELTMLGIGHLNLHNHQYGFEYLVQASELSPNNVVLSSQVNALRIRLDEMKRRDEVHEAMPKGKTILIVDDSPTVRKLIAGKLEKCGHDVVCASDGVEAIERLDELVPDLVLLDITMPRMDGYQVCKLIRSNPATQDVPVVMISGKDGFFDKVRGRMAGTTGYITKPFGPETLMKAVETYLEHGAVTEQVS